jgi:Flp pilus assembly protein TadG
MRLQKRPKGERDERGQSLVETALVLPFLLLLLMIVVDAARAFDALIVLTNAAREGARYASLEPTPRDELIYEFIQEDVLGSGTNITHMDQFTKTNIAYTDTEKFSSEPIIVTVTLSYDFPLWFGGLVGLDTVQLEKSATMASAEIEEDR